jgi:membrane protease YdiL (CAAX protease family)
MINSKVFGMINKISSGFQKKIIEMSQKDKVLYFGTTFLILVDIMGAFFFVKDNPYSWFLPIKTSLAYLTYFILFVLLKNELKESPIDGFSIILLIVFNSATLFANFFSFLIIFSIAITLFVWCIRSRKEGICTISKKQIQGFGLGIMVGFVFAIVKLIVIQPKLISFVFQYPGNLFSSFLYGLNRGPLLEEFLYRGLLIWGLQKVSLKDKWIILLSSLMWAIIHIGIFGNIGIFASMIKFLDIFIGGLIFGLLVRKTKFLSSGIAAHTAYNAVIDFRDLFVNFL